MAESTLQTYVNGNPDLRQTLVVVFLRGGADGLSLVAPLLDDDYHRMRPRLALGAKEAVPLDGAFGLHPRLEPLARAFREGQLLIVHAAGSEDTTRSHFEAQDLMEHGGVAAGGWLGRFLQHRQGTGRGALPAVALGRELPECLRGAPSVTVLESLDEFALSAPDSWLDALAQLYAAERNELGQSARDTLQALRRLADLRETRYVPAHGADYGTDNFSRELMQVARLIKARVGLEAASVDLGGWDSHFAQGTLIEPLMSRLATGLAAFCRDLGSDLDRTTVVVMTEFGRRVYENASFGTDHGRGSVMFVLGGGVQGGRVLGQWPGLKGDALEGPGDLRVTTNYRNVLAPILQRYGAADVMDRVFPDFQLDPLPLYG